MRRTVVLLVSVILFISMLVLGVVSKMQAQQGQQGQACTLASLNGSYGVRLTGFRITSTTTSIPTASIATITFNGAGVIVPGGVFTNNTNGSVSSGTITGGFYTVGTNCFGHLTIMSMSGVQVNTSTADLVIVAQGGQIQILETTNGIVDDGIAIKQ